MEWPHKNEAPGGCNAEGPRDTSERETSVASEPGDGKRFATLRAELALRGFGLSALADGSYLIHKWNLSRPVADLRGAATFLWQIGGAA